MMDEKVKVLKVIGLGSFRANIGDDDGYSRELKTMTDWIEENGYSYGEIYKKHKSEGKWSVMVDGSKFAYFLLTQDTYADRLSGALLRDTEAVMIKLIQGHASEKEINKSVRQLKDRYCSPEEFDQITAANCKVDQVQVQ